MTPAYNRATKAAILGYLACRGVDSRDREASTRELLRLNEGRALCRFYLEYVYMGETHQ